MKQIISLLLALVLMLEALPLAAFATETTAPEETIVETISTQPIEAEAIQETLSVEEVTDPTGAETDPSIAETVPPEETAPTLAPSTEPSEIPTEQVTEPTAVPTEPAPESTEETTTPSEETTAPTDSAEETVPAQTIEETMPEETEPLLDAAATSGSCGDNATWEFYDGILYIRGSGELTKCNYSQYPWWDLREKSTVCRSPTVSPISRHMPSQNVQIFLSHPFRILSPALADMFSPNAQPWK